MQLLRGGVPIDSRHWGPLDRRSGLDPFSKKDSKPVKLAPSLIAREFACQAPGRVLTAAEPASVIKDVQMEIATRRYMLGPNGLDKVKPECVDVIEDRIPDSR